MTAKEFTLKYNINWHDILSDEFFKLLDILYLDFTKEQSMTMLSDFYDHADEIYNSLHENKVDKSKKD